MNLLFCSYKFNLNVILADGVLKHFEIYKQNWFKTEAGGQLFMVFDDDKTIRIIKATGPRKEDKRSRFFYMPDKKSEQKEIDDMYHLGLHYIGDWHTHPSKIPVPSHHDKRSLRSIYEKSIHNMNFFLLVVVGKANFPDGIYISMLNDTMSDVLICLDRSK